MKLTRFVVDESPLQQGKPQVILLDLMMPEMDGFAVVAALQKEADPLGVTSSTPRRSNSIDWSRRCGVFSRTASEDSIWGYAPAKLHLRLRGVFLGSMGS
jgi:hypothetical protein